MKTARTLAICAIGIVCSAAVAAGQDLSRYRDFTLRTDLAAVAGLAGIDASDAKTIHRRPALLQDLEWRPSHWIPGSTAASTDPVEQMAFSFYDDQLFRIVVDYGRERTEGMTAADMIEAISGVYGPALLASTGAGRAASRLETESGSRVARWGDGKNAVTLYQLSSYGVAFRLIVTDVALDALARTATGQAVRLDDQEAPQREVARQQKDRADRNAAAAKARVANKGVFRP